MKLGTASVSAVEMMMSIGDLLGLFKISENTLVISAFQAFTILLLFPYVPFIVYLEVLLHAEKEGNSGRATPDLTLYWDSWDSGTQAPLLPSVPSHNNDTVTQATSPSILMNTNVQSTSSQSTKDNQTPPSTPSILNRRGNDELEEVNEYE